MRKYLRAPASPEVRCRSGQRVCSAYGRLLVRLQKIVGCSREVLASYAISLGSHPRNRWICFRLWFLLRGQHLLDFGILICSRSFSHGRSLGHQSLEFIAAKQQEQETTDEDARENSQRTE